MNDGQMLAELRATFPTLDLWREHIANSIVPAEGSDLATLDARWKYAPPSTLATVGIASAREHLHAVRLLVEAGELFPSAASTLCRSALVGAAQTTWMLSAPDSNTRLQRALSLALEDYRQHIKFGNATITARDHIQLHPTAGEQMARLQQRCDAIRVVLQEVGGPLPINMTDDVLPAALLGTPGNDEFRAAARLRWRSMSGGAHSLVWQHFGQPGTAAESKDVDGVAQIVVGGDIASLAMDYFTAFRVAAAAWQLLAMRADRPDLLGGFAS